MRVARLELRNFRSFGLDKVEIELPETENLVSLIGSNNAGKTNLLEALRMVLSAPTRRPSPEDFWNRDTSVDTRVQVHLREPIRLANIYKSTDEIGGFYWRAYRKAKGEETGMLDYDHYAFKLGEPNSPYVPPAAVGGKKSTDPGVEPPKWRPEPASRLLSNFGPVHHLDLRLEEAFKTVGRSILARLLDLYRDDFDADHNQYTITETEGPVKSREAYDRLMTRLDGILRTDLLERLEASLTQNLQQYLGREGQAAHVAIGPPSAEELLRRLLELKVADRADGPLLPIERMGAGYQSLLRLALLETHVEFGLGGARGLYLLEEPEAYLQPHLRRHLRTLLQTLAAEGSDVVVVTHDPNLIDLTKPQSLLRLAKTEDGISRAYRPSSSLHLNPEIVARKLGGKGNDELPFAERAVLCEGQDDVAVIRIIAGRLGLLLDPTSISVADCGGRENLPDYASFCAQLHIPYLVVTDGDLSKAADNTKVAEQVGALRAQVREDPLGSYFALEENLEQGLGGISKGIEHSVAAAESLPLEGDAAPSGFVELVGEVREFCGPLRDHDEVEKEEEQGSE